MSGRFPGRLHSARAARVARAAGFALLAVASGCAYSLTHEAEVLDAGRLSRVRTIAVAPFRYPHRWTGFFRGIYRAAELEPPPAEKLEEIEATFLPEGVLARRGYEIRDWPKTAGGVDWAANWEAGAPEVRSALLKVLVAGAEAVLVVRGWSECPELHRCTSEVEMRLVDAEAGSVIWRARAEGETLIGQGNEMRAAVEEALAELPAPSP